MPALVRKIVPFNSAARLTNALYQSFILAIGKLWHPLGNWNGLLPKNSDRSAPPQKTAREQAQLVSLVFAVCLSMFLIKALIAFRDLDNPEMPPWIVDGRFLRSLVRVGACCTADFGVGLSCLFFALVSLHLLKSTFYRRIVRLTAQLSAVAAVAYMVANAQIFHVLRRFLTLSQLQLAGGIHLEHSIYEHVTAAVVLSVGLLPLLTLALHLILVRAFPGFWNKAAYFLCRPLVLLILITGMFRVAQEAEQTWWFDEHYSDFAQSPHLLFARSFVADWLDDWESGAGLNDGTSNDAETEGIADFLLGRPQHSANLLVRRPRNIIVIVLESASSLYMQAYGSPLATTPHLNKLKDKGILFSNFYATTDSSVGSALPIFASIYNDPNTVATIMEYPYFPVIGAASWLRKQGYKTCFLAANGRNWQSYRHMADIFLAHGFDVALKEDSPFWHDAQKSFRDEDYKDAELFEDAKRYLRAAGQERFFLLMWNYDTHFPYYSGNSPPWLEERSFPVTVARGEKQEECRSYLRSLRRVDAFIGELYRELVRLKLAEDTLLVVTGDHGEAFGQHGQFYHGDTIYEEEVRVPLILISPLLAPLGTRRNVLGSHVDMWPTITDVCGLPADPAWQGRSLFSQDPPEERRVYFSARTRKRFLGVREGRYKYIWDRKNKEEQLFDLERDLGERVNIARDREPLCLQLRQRLRAWAGFQKRLTLQRLAGGQ